MSISANMADMIEDVRVRCNLPTFSTLTFVTSTEVLRYFQVSAQKLTGVLRRTFGDDYFTQVANIATTANTSAVALPASFGSLRRVAWLKTPTEPVPLKMASIDEWSGPNNANAKSWTDSEVKYRLTANGIRFYPTPNAVYNLELYYQTGISIATAVDVLQVEPLWAEYLVNDVCHKIAVKEKRVQDIQTYAIERATLEQAIKDMAPVRDEFGQHQVRDARGVTGQTDRWPYRRGY